MPLTVHARALQRAAEILGGKERLRAHLGASMRDVEAWLSGAERAPTDVFLMAVDVIASNRASAADIREAILARPGPASRPEKRSLLSFLHQRFEPGHAKEMAEAALDAAISGTAACKGNLQLACPDGLRLGAHRGFERPFLEFFALVNDERSACGKAMREGRRVVVPDLAADPLFAGTREGEVLAEAGVRAVQSTPLIAASGWVLGMLSTHYDKPHTPSEDELQVIDRVAARTAYWLEGGAG